jgi:hypothetical protein
MAAISRVGSIKHYFTSLKDPRVRKRTEHRLIDIIAIALCGVIANCDGWTDIIDFAKNRLAWFKGFLKLPNGIPSHDTFERVFAKIDPAAFNRCCIAWLHDVSDLVGLGHIAIDGKTLRGSASYQLGPLHLVSAWATQANLTLGEVAVEGKSNEIEAIPELLKLLDLKGALVTIDAGNPRRKRSHPSCRKRTHPGFMISCPSVTWLSSCSSWLSSTRGSGNFRHSSRKCGSGG